MSRPRRGSVAERRQRNRRGRSAELAAAALVMAKGYRILSRRYLTPLGEIDLIAAGHGRLLFVEVKARRSLADIDEAVSDPQAARIHGAAELWLARHARYQGHAIRFDLIIVEPWRWPRHIADAF
jgi:putative endonuclease